MLSNEMDREPTRGIDPHRIVPTGKKLVIKRAEGAEKVGKIIVPKGTKLARPTFEGTVIALGNAPPEECAELKKGDRVWFSHNVGGDDSAFLAWKDGYYAVIPFDAVQAVAVSA